MTGLDVENDTIMSIACFITDAQLNLLDDEGWEVRIHHSREALDNMNEWCIRTHGQSGLTAECLESETTADQAADDLLRYIKRFVRGAQKGLLAGSSVHCDRAFLSRPPYDRVTEYLHYRIMDVSSIKEAAYRWAPMEVMKGVPRKKGLHQAKEDILESIGEARYYREKLFMK